MAARGFAKHPRRFPSRTTSGDTTLGDRAFAMPAESKAFDKAVHLTQAVTNQGEPFPQG